MLQNFINFLSKESQRGKWSQECKVITKKKSCQESPKGGSSCLEFGLDIKLYFITSLNLSNFYFILQTLCCKSWTFNAVLSYPLCIALYLNPDLDKVRHFGEILKVIGHLWMVYFVLGQIWNLLWQKFCAIEQLSIVVNGQIWKK